MGWRTVDLEGAVNLRDFGGYRTADGRTVRRGLLFRSGSLARLTAQGRHGFESLRVGLICDLRRPDEQAREPTPFPADVVPRLEIPIDPGSAAVMRQRLGEDVLDVAERIDFMVAINRELARDHAADYARMFAGLLAMNDGAFLVHCSAGKDRTGLACALILHALGVPEETVLEDYLLTNAHVDIDARLMHLANVLEPERVPDRESEIALAGVRTEYLRAAYQAIEGEFEDVERYIERAVGLDAADRARLRARLLE